MKETALITGASGGIGLELARLMAADGISLVLVARNESKLAAIKKELEDKGGEVLLMPGDLTNEGFRTGLYHRLVERGISVDYLVNNAGMGDFGEYIHTKWEKGQELLNLNIMSLAHLTHLILGPMIKRKKGRILNIASIAAFQPGPYMSLYYASKAFVLSFSEALHKETQGTGVTVTALCPGPTNTGFVEVANLEESMLFKSLKVAGAKEVAEYGYKVMKKGKAVAVHGFSNKVLVFSVRLAPRRLVRYIASKIQGKKGS